MENPVILKDTDSLDKFELTLLQLENEELKDEIGLSQMGIDLQKGIEEKFWINLTKIVGEEIDLLNEKRKIPKKDFLKAMDETFGKPGDLIQPSHYYRRHSLIKKRQHSKDITPVQVVGSGILTSLLMSSAARNSEIIRDYTADNTKLAFNGDVIYWQAWLSAVGFDFNEPISTDIVKLFVIQHIEEMDPVVDKTMVGQGYKFKLGCHALSTVKRRIVHLSVCLDLDKHKNPCKDKELRMLLGRLSKKYGGGRRKKAITLDVLNDFLDTCKDSTIDIRDRSILLFAWSSGGRRRNEVVNAKIENLTETEGDYTYRLEKSKSDQEGVGHELPILGRAAKALKDWLNLFDASEGPIFRSITKSGIVKDKPLSGIDINRIVKKRAKLSGYDESQFGAHSLRSGFVTESGRQGKPIGDIMAMTTHRSVSTAMKYYESGAIINNSAASLAG